MHLDIHNQWDWGVQTFHTCYFYQSIYKQKQQKCWNYLIYIKGDIQFLELKIRSMTFQIKWNLLIIVSLLIFSSLSKEIILKNKKFYDKQGREVTLHGTNVVVKTPPYIPLTQTFDAEFSYSVQDIKLLKQNGFNAIRLGVMWAGVQPKKDWYNETYLQEMLKIVNLSGEAGIYSLVEFHQDLLSQMFCGDGVPIWLMNQIKSYKTFPFPVSKKIPLNDSGLPDWNDCDQKNWGQYYFSYDVAQGFNSLYNTNHYLSKKFTQYWQKLAQTFKGNPYVMSYELINEPFVGNLWRNPLLIVPSVAERLKFQNFYDQLALKIRAIDPQTPICFQPITFDNFIPTGFSHPPGGRKYENQSIFCYHHYQPPALSIKSMETYVKDGQKLNVATLLSQTFAGQEVLKKAEELKQSWFYWHYKDYGKNWGAEKNSSNAPLIELLTGNNSIIPNRVIRTYFQRVAGKIENYSYEPETGHFVGTYWATPGGQTILFVNKEVSYPNGCVVNTLPEENVIIQENGNFISIKYTGEEKNRKLSVTVTKL